MLGNMSTVLMNIKAIVQQHFLESTLLENDGLAFLHPSVFRVRVSSRGLVVRLSLNLH